MKLREFFVRHWRGVQAIAVLLAIGLTVLVTVRIDRAMYRTHVEAADSSREDPLGLLIDLDASKPKYWPIQNGPDSSTMALTTKCVNGSVFYQFDVLTTPKMYARYDRTSGKAPRFRLALLDSNEFKIGSVAINEEDVIAAKDSMGKIAYLSAKDVIQLPCNEYRKLKAWDPAWTLAR